MQKLPLDRLITLIDQQITDHPELRNPLDFHKMTLKAQEHLRESDTKGTHVDWTDKAILNELMQNSKKSNQPMAYLLQTSVFIPEVLLPTLEQMKDVLIEHGGGEEWLNNFYREVELGNIEILDAVGAALNGNAEYFDEQAAEYGTDPGLFLFLVSTLIQPCLEEIARNVDSQYLEGWWQALCPVCGRQPIVARLKDRKRHLVCMFCGAEYLADLFLCVNCGNKEPDTLKFLSPEDYPEFRVEYCEKCRHYIKVIDENRVKKPIPKGLEDLMTIDLDLMAESAGLTRKS